MTQQRSNIASVERWHSTASVPFMRNVSIGAADV